MKYLQSKYHPINFLLFVLCVFTHVWILHAYESEMANDELFELAAIPLFNQTDSYGLKTVATDDVNEIIFDWGIRKPKGYAAFASAMGLVTTQWNVDFVLDILAGLIYFLAWFLFFRLFRSKINVAVLIGTWLFWLIIPVGLFTSIFRGHTSDGLSIAFLSMGIYLTCRYIIKPESKTILLGALSGICLGLAASLHYLYWSYGMALFCLYLLFYFIRKYVTKDTLNIGFSFILSQFTCYGLLLLVTIKTNLNIAGSVTRSNPGVIGDPVFNWHHFDQLTLFPLHILGLMDINNWLVIRKHEYTVSLPSRLFESLFLVIILSALSAFIFPKLAKLVRSKSMTKIELAHSFFVLSSFLITGFIFFLLSYVSIKANPHGVFDWLYFKELRYFAPVVLLLFICLVFFLSEPIRSNTYTSKFILGIKALLLLCFIYAVSLLIPWKLQQFKYGLKTNSPNYMIAFKKKGGAFGSALEVISANNGYPTIYLQDHYIDISSYNRNMAMIYAVPVLHNTSNTYVVKNGKQVLSNPDSFFELELKSKEKTNVIVGMYHHVEGYEVYEDHLYKKYNAQKVFTHDRRKLSYFWFVVNNS